MARKLRQFTLVFTLEFVDIPSRKSLPIWQVQEEVSKVCLQCICLETAREENSPDREELAWQGKLSQTGKTFS